MLADAVRSLTARWRDVRSYLREDARWSTVRSLSEDDKEDLFEAHIGNLKRKRAAQFHELIDTTPDLSLASSWDEARALICTDVRFERFSDDDRDREDEYTRYTLLRKERALREFRELLEETKCITHKSLSAVGEAGGHMKEILSSLENDKRYLDLAYASDERAEHLSRYMQELDTQGAPLPPTASKPTERR